MVFIWPKYLSKFCAFFNFFSLQKLKKIEFGPPHIQHCILEAGLSPNAKLANFNKDKLPELYQQLQSAEEFIQKGTEGNKKLKVILPVPFFPLSLYFPSIFPFKSMIFSSKFSWNCKIIFQILLVYFFSKFQNS